MEILKYPDPRLKQVSETVDSFDDQLREFIRELEQTMRAGPGGVGIAAPQVGCFRQIVIVDVSSRAKVTSHGCMVLINPELVRWEGLELGREGCMSVPDYTGNVIRATSVTVQAQNEYGESQQFDCDGYEARAVQHEIDHLQGMLFLDRLVSRRNDLFRRKVYRKK